MSDNKFKVGDKVRIRQELIFAQYQSGDYDTIVEIKNGLYGLKYFDQEAVGDEPWLDNSAKWPEKHLLPYVEEVEDVQP